MDSDSTREIVDVDELDLNRDYQLPGLLVAIMAQQTNNAHSSWSALAESYQRSWALERARVVLMTEKLSKQLKGPYMPNPIHLLDALYPDAEEVRLLAEEILADEYIPN